MYIYYNKKYVTISNSCKLAACWLNLFSDMFYLASNSFWPSLCIKKKFLTFGNLEILYKIHLKTGLASKCGRASVLGGGQLEPGKACSGPDACRAAIPPHVLVSTAAQRLRPFTILLPSCFSSQNSQTGEILL